MTSTPWPLRIRTHRPSATSQSRRVLSAEPERRRCSTPGYLAKASAVTRLLWPTSVPAKETFAAWGPREWDEVWGVGRSGADPFPPSGRRRTMALRAAYA